MAYHDAALMTILAAGLGAAGFAWEGWNPVLGLVLAGGAMSVLWALILAKIDSPDTSEDGPKAGGA